MKNCLRLALLGVLLLVGTLAVTVRPSPAAPAAPVEAATRPTVEPTAYQGDDMSQRPVPKFNYSKLFVATPGSPLNLPAPGTSTSTGRVAGVTFVPPPSPDTTVRTDAAIRAMVEQELAKITARTPHTVRYLGTPPADIFARYNFTVRDPVQTVVVVVQCDCDATALMPHTENAKWLIWLVDRQYGSKLVATEGSTFVQELLNDPTIPLPVRDRVYQQTGVRLPAQRPNGTTPFSTTPQPLMPPPFAR